MNRFVSKEDLTCISQSIFNSTYAKKRKTNANPNVLSSSKWVEEKNRTFQNRIIHPCLPSIKPRWACYAPVLVAFACFSSRVLSFISQRTAASDSVRRRFLFGTSFVACKCFNQSGPQPSSFPISPVCVFPLNIDTGGSPQFVRYLPASFPLIFFFLSVPYFVFSWKREFPVLTVHYSLGRDRFFLSKEGCRSAFVPLDCFGVSANDWRYNRRKRKKNGENKRVTALE